MTSEPDLSGFSGWIPFTALPTASVPTDPGVYVVLRPSDEPPEFLDSSPAGHFKGKDPTVPVTELRELWVPGTRIVYIGKANAGAGGRRGLRKRLDEFRRHGAGEPVGHSGGRRIWQLADSPALLVGWRTTDETTAAATETQMIAQFRAHHGRLPFANMRGCCHGPEASPAAHFRSEARGGIPPSPASVGPATSRSTGPYPSKPP